MIKEHKKFDLNGKQYFWFTILAPNNRVLATSETYNSKQAMKKGIKALIKSLSSV